MRIDQQDGMELPIPFAIGYVNANISEWGMGPLCSYISIAKDILITEHGTDIQWSNGIIKYVNGEKQDYQPLEYLQAALIMIGYERTFRGHWVHPSKAIPGLRWRFRALGQSWWWGKPPATYGMPSLSLRRLIGPTIITKLHHIKVKRVINESTLTSLGVALFVQEFVRQSKVPCRLYQKGTQLIVKIEVCPCCMGYTEGCGVFVGVFEALLSWLQGSYYSVTVRGIARCWIVDPDNTDHTIVIETVKQQN